MSRWLTLLIAVGFFCPSDAHCAKPKPYRQPKAVVRPEYDLRNLKPLGGDDGAPVPFDRSIMELPLVPGSAYTTSSMATPPLPSPGLAIGNTTYDYQHNGSQGYQVARVPGADVVHFAWTALDRFSWDGWNDRYVAYNSYTISTHTVNQGFNGVFIGLSNSARAGYTGLAVDDSNRAHTVLHQKEDPSFPYHAWRILMPISGNALHTDDELANPSVSTDVYWARITVSQNSGATDIVHEIAMENTASGSRRVYYWRNNGATWQGPALIDSTDIPGYVIASAGDRDRVAIVLHTTWEPGFSELRNIAYYESQTEGLGWLDGSELGPTYKRIVTNYTDPNGPQAWAHISTVYDHGGTLHIVWDEQCVANKTSEDAVQHWNNARNTIRTVAQGYWPTPYSRGVWNLNLSKITLGVGDGSTLCQGGAVTNLNDLYVLYTRFAGPTQAEQDDHSLLGFYNGELCLNVSSDGGLTWSPPQNLTNTKTPNCNPGLPDSSTGRPQRPDSVCRSENWATIGQDVSDIDIFYISDIEAGAWPSGESPWQQNPVMYLRLLGHTTDAPYVCPSVGPCLNVRLAADPECEYHTPPGTVKNDITLALANLGNAELSGTTSVLPGASWLTLTAAGPFTLLPGGSELVMNLDMNASGLSEGVYSGTIRIVHNDPSQPSPLDLLIQLVVADQFFCGQDEILKTSVAGPGGLALEIESTGRYGSQSARGGLYRALDGSSSIYDASLVLAHGSQGPDTVVFHRFGDGIDPGGNGFRAMSSWSMDTSAYGLGQGFASASCEMATKDSAVGILLDWVFPQNPDSADFVLAEYRVFNRTAAPIESLVVGQWVDFDVVGSTSQSQDNLATANTSGVHSPLNFVYQIQMVTHYCGYCWPSPYYTYGTHTAGISYVSGPEFSGEAYPIRAGTERAAPSGLASSQSRSAFMYDRLIGPSAYDVVDCWPGVDADCIDVLTFMTLDQGRRLGVGDTLRYVVAIVSDTSWDPPTGPIPDTISLYRTVRKAWAWAGHHGFGCDCHCQSDPECDGRTDVLDVIRTIDRAFRGLAPTKDVTCFAHSQTVDGRTDINCSGATDVLDVVVMINVAFRGQDPATQFCRLCVN